MKKTSLLLSIIGSLFLTLSVHGMDGGLGTSPSIPDGSDGERHDIPHNPRAPDPGKADIPPSGTGPIFNAQITCSKAKANLALLEMNKKKVLDEYYKQKKNSIDILGGLCSSYQKMNDSAYYVSHAKDDRDRFCNNYEATRGVAGATPPLLTCDPLCEAFNKERSLSVGGVSRLSHMSCEEAKERVKVAMSQKGEATADYFQQKQKSGDVVENMCKQYQILNRLSAEISRAKDTKRSACEGNNGAPFYSTPIGQMYDPFCQAVIDPSFSKVSFVIGSDPDPEDRGISSDGDSTGGAAQ